MTCRSGDVFLARLDPVVGSEQAATRRVVVLQNPDLARLTSTVLCIPLTTNLKALRFPGTCLVERGECGSEQDAVALAFQLRALDRLRLIKRYGRLSAAALESVADAALNALGIEVIQ